MLPSSAAFIETHCRQANRAASNKIIAPHKRNSPCFQSFFSKMTRQMLRGIRVNTKEELEERIYRYFDEVNREPVIYHWKYKMDEISEEEAASV